MKKLQVLNENYVPFNLAVKKAITEGSSKQKNITDFVKNLVEELFSGDDNEIKGSAEYLNFKYDPTVQNITRNISYVFETKIRSGLSTKKPLYEALRLSEAYKNMTSSNDTFSLYGGLENVEIVNENDGLYLQWNRNEYSQNMMKLYNNYVNYLHEYQQIINNPKLENKSLLENVLITLLNMQELSNV